MSSSSALRTITPHTPRTRRGVELLLLAFALAIVLLIVTDGAALAGAPLLPVPQFVAPVFEIGAMVGIGLPLYVVTMAGQNIPGIAVLTSFGFAAHSRPGIVSTGALSGVSAIFGGVPINYAALSAARRSSSSSTAV